jgi:hypothetical protein
MNGVAQFLLAARFFAKTRRCESGCLVWTGALSRGGQRPHSGLYGSFWIQGQNSVRAHVVAAWMAGLIGETRVPEGMHLDHVCENTLCVDPRHLELVPAPENIARYHNGRDHAPPVYDPDEVPF